ncbi:uncharacterized protein LOC116108095 [Pistacia vera]|uniref:uncharacterized protein LOC116108095 n=1 Tax=Pistacia vera TaxID=55513 RepID=UPI0012635F50|nr:uncharacterized protein LOC116108095 [Pistacia vera]
MATSNSREERRRKIMARGSDRLALITGKSPSLPSDHDPPNQSSPLTLSSDHHPNPLKDAGSLDASGFTLLKRDTGVKVSGENRYDEIVNQIEHQHDTSKEASAVEDMTKSEPWPATLIAETPLNDTQPVPKPSRINQLNLFSCKQVNSCIIASQNTRSFCALIIALLVVLSYIDYPYFGMNIVRSEGIVASRPLYILLLTDVTIVLAQLYLEERTHSEEAEKEKVIPQEEKHNLIQAIQIMEKGLVVYQSIWAVFIDFSIYVVVVVCGLSLV